jgi:glycine cleavage system regulatory protein
VAPHNFQLFSEVRSRHSESSGGFSLFPTQASKPKESAMEWTYQITAASRPRVLMRLVQLFDQQSLVIRSLELALLDNRVKINLTVDADAALAHRIQAKLYHQLDIQEVDLVAE